MKILIVPMGMHVTDKKTKSNHVQEDMRKRPNQQSPEFKTTPEAASEAMPAESAVEFARELALNHATNPAAAANHTSQFGIVNLPHLL